MRFPISAIRADCDRLDRAAVMILELTDDELEALTRLLRRTLDNDRFPLAPSLGPLKAILAKIEPPRARQATGTTPEPYPPRATARQRCR